MGKFGINAILGLEYKLNIPLTLQLDFRPGYGLAFYGEDYIDYDVHGNESKSRVHCAINYFDWSVNAGVRYKF